MFGCAFWAFFDTIQYKVEFFSDSVTEIAGVGLDIGGGSTGAVSPFSAPE